MTKNCWHDLQFSPWKLWVIRIAVIFMGLTSFKPFKPHSNSVLSIYSFTFCQDNALFYLQWSCARFSGIHVSRQSQVAWYLWLCLHGSLRKFLVFVISSNTSDMQMTVDWILTRNGFALTAKEESYHIKSVQSIHIL